MKLYINCERDWTSIRFKFETFLFIKNCLSLLQLDLIEFVNLSFEIKIVSQKNYVNIEAFVLTGIF